MKSIMGLLGAFILAFGATIVFSLYMIYTDYPFSISSMFPPLIPFLGFLLIGIGLWLIVLSGKAETKQNPS